MYNTESDPLMANAFYIVLELDNSNDRLDGIFKKCSGFDFTQEVIQFREVTNQPWGNATKGRSRLTKLPGNAGGGNLTLNRGLNISRTFWLWFASVQKGNWFQQRKTMSITFNRGEEVKVCYQFTEAWPTRYRIGEMGVDGGGEEIEELEIAYEGFERIL